MPKQLVKQYSFCEFISGLGIQEQIAASANKQAFI